MPHLEITTKIGCKINCRFCPQDKLIKSYCSNRTQDDMELSYEDFCNCVDKLPTNVDIHFSGMCEPWLNKDCSKMLRYAFEKGHSISVYTTLVGMGIEDYKIVRECKFKDFVIHIPDEENNSCIPITELWLEVFNQIVSDIKAKRIRVTGFSCHGAVNERIKPVIDELGYIQMHDEMHDRAGNLENELAVLKKGDLAKQRRVICKYCGIKMNRNILLPDGTVLLCCMDYSNEYIIGNLINEEWKNIDEGTRKQLFRERLLNCESGFICNKCTCSVEIWKYYPLFLLRAGKDIFMKLRYYVGL